jgi:hypothetical protein
MKDILLTLLLLTSFSIYGQNYSFNSFNIVKSKDFLHITTNISDNVLKKYIEVRRISNNKNGLQSITTLHEGDMNSKYFTQSGKYMIKTIIYYKNNKQKQEIKYIYIK